MKQDPRLNQRLEEAEAREEEYLARHVEIGYFPDKRARSSLVSHEEGAGDHADIELDSKPEEKTEKRDGRSRAGSTPTYRTDIPELIDDGIDVPIPDAGDL